MSNIDTIDGLIKTISESRDQKITVTKQNILNNASPKIGSKTITVTDVVGPFHYKYKKQKEIKIKETQRIKNIEKWSQILVKLENDIDLLSDTHEVLKQAGIENPRIISERDMEVIKSMNIVHVDEDPDVQNGMICYKLPILGSNEYFTLHGSENIIRKKISLFKTLQDKKGSKYFLGKFRLPDAPKYMIEAQKLFSKICAEKKFKIISKKIIIKEKCIQKRSFWRKEIIQEKVEEIFLKERFKVFYIIDYSILDNQIVSIYEKTNGAIKKEDPIIGIKDMKNNTYHIGPHYGGDALIGEKKCLDTLRKFYIYM